LLYTSGLAAQVHSLNLKLNTKYEMSIYMPVSPLHARNGALCRPSCVVLSRLLRCCAKWRSSSIHAGSRTPNAGVLSWLQHLKSSRNLRSLS
jgi:hypothetical protein